MMLQGHISCVILFVFCFCGGTMAWGQSVDSACAPESDTPEMVAPQLSLTDSDIYGDVPDVLSVPCLKIDSHPVDARIEDSVWQHVLPTYENEAHQSVSTMVLYSDSYVSVMVVLPLRAPYNLPNHWEWSKRLKAYKPGQDSELSVAVILTDHPLAEVRHADAWIFHASRSYESGFADDCFLLANERVRPEPEDALNILFPRPKFRPDAGAFAWRSMYYSSYAGKSPRRFYSARPDGSAGDVRVFSEWSDGAWTIEFRRLRETGHADDVGIDFDQPLLMQINVSVPGEKDWNSPVFSIFSQDEKGAVLLPENAVEDSTP